MPKLINKYDGNQTARNVAEARKVYEKSKKGQTFVEYQQFKQPTATGIYAVRVPMTGTDVWCEDRFMFWDNERKRWGYLGSTENYRGIVVGWIGPLRRLHQVDDTPF